MVETETKTVLRIIIDADIDCGNPATEYDGQWTPIIFLSNHVDFKNPDELEDDLESIKQKMEVGLAFFMSYTEHGLCNWSISGEGYECQWDTTRNAGILIWEHDPDDMGAKTYEERKKDAARFLEEYTDWCNGSCYQFDIKKITECDCFGHEIEEKLDSCCGFIGSDAVADGVSESLASLLEEYPDAEITYDGDSDWIAPYVKVNRDTN